MPAMDVSTATVSDMANIVKDVEIDAKSTEGTTEQKETRFQNTAWSTYYGIYRTIPEVKTAIDMRAIWTVGKSYTTPDAKTEIILEGIKGYGNDTFNSILKNMIVCRRIGGDSYAEIIRSNDQIINIKPLDPGSIVVVTNKAGIIIRYEQTKKVGEKSTYKKFSPKDIFHLVNKRVADGILGISDIEALQEIVKANNESFVMQKKVIRRFGIPRWMFYLNTDNQTKITAFMTKADSATNLGENIYCADKVVKAELQSVPAQASINILPWREHLKNYFFQVVGIPQIILGSSGEFTESTAKIAYLAFQQSVEDEQMDIENAVWNQLYLKVELAFPATMQNELISDQSKDAAQGMEQQPQDTAVTQGGVV